MGITNTIIEAITREDNIRIRERIETSSWQIINFMELILVGGLVLIMIQQQSLMSLLVTAITGICIVLLISYQLLYHNHTNELIKRKKREN